MKMKKHILAFSILFIFMNGLVVASEQEQKITIDINIEDREPEENDNEYLKPEIERLYPQYIKNTEDSDYQQYVWLYESRHIAGLYLFYTQDSLSEYQSEIAQRKIRKLDPKMSKLDAKLYQNIKSIYEQLEEIENTIKIYTPFMHAILYAIEVDQPYPILFASENRAYQKSLTSMYTDLNKIQKDLKQLNQKIDDYADQLEQFSDIDSKKVVKEHAKNITQLNLISLRIGQVLSTHLKAEDIYSSSIILIDEEDEATQRIEKLKQYAQSPTNVKKVQNLMASIPKNTHDVDEYKDEYDEAFSQLGHDARNCQYVWRGEEVDVHDLEYINMSKEKYLNLCETTKKSVEKILTEKVFFEPVPFKTIELDHLYYLANFKRYGHNIYYTNEEKNALYRLNLETGKSEIIIQKQLEDDDSSCTHNMCRGVGAIDVVLDHDRKYAYVASLDYDQIAVIDLSKKEIIQTYPVERYPRKLLLDKKGEYLFVYNGVSNSISRIHLKSHEIKTVTLPEAYQQHFCRTIDMVWSEETEFLKILGDWPTKPYVYLDVKDMEFKNSVIEVPYKSLFEKQPFQWVVQKADSDTYPYGVYDIRLDKVIENVIVQYEQAEDEQYIYQVSPVLFGRLNNQFFYVVDQAYSRKYNDLMFPFLGRDEYSQAESGLYNLHLISNDEKIIFPLKFKPESIELLEDNKLLIAYGEAYGNEKLTDEHLEELLDSEDQSLSSNKKIEIYDLNNAELRKISKRNESKALNEIYVSFANSDED